MDNRYYIVGCYHPVYPDLELVTYSVSWKAAERYAKSINRELAEGPTVYIPDNYFGPVELWPLVRRNNAISR